MRDAFRYLFLLVIALFVLSFNLVQCRSTLSQTMDREQRSLRNIDYINMCMFRKTRLCDYLREMDHTRYEVEPREDRELWKRGISQFYSNW